MKKIIFILFIFSSHTSFPQYIGVKAIGSVSYSANHKARLGVSGGVFIQEDISKHFSLRQEAIFSLDGYSIKKEFYPKVLPSGDTSIYIVGLKNVEYQINSLEIPLIIIFKTGDKIKPYISSGFSLKFAVLSRQKINVAYREEFYEKINSLGFDAPIINSIGIESKINKSPVHLELRYSQGLLRVVNNNRLSSLSIMFGFKV